MLLVVTVLGVGLPWLANGILGEPNFESVATARGDAGSAERKLQAIESASRRQGHRGSTIVLSEREVSAFLATHLPDLAGTPLGAIRVRLKEGGRIELAARTSIRAPLGELAGWEKINLLPSGWLEQPLWLHLDARTRLEEGGDGERQYLRLDIERFYLGRRRLPAFLLRLFLDPTTLGLLRWPVPPTVDGVEVERGRIMIRTRPSR